MDPNETLRLMRLAVKDDLDQLADLFEALDGWLSKGGFLPAAWRQVIPWQEPQS